MVDTSKDNNLEIESRKKELDSLIEKYKNDVQELVKYITNLPYYECTNSYNTTPDSHAVGKPKLCPKELPICSNYKVNVQMGSCIGYDIKTQIASINESEKQIQEKLDKLQTYNSVGIKDYNLSEANLDLSYKTLTKNIDDLKDSKKQLKKALEYHDDLTGKNASLKQNITSNYIMYIIWTLLLIKTVFITILSFIAPNLISTELLMLYLIFLCILIYISSPYFDLK